MTRQLHLLLRGDHNEDNHASPREVTGPRPCAVATAPPLLWKLGSALPIWIRQGPCPCTLASQNLCPKTHSVHVCHVNPVGFYYYHPRFKMKSLPRGSTPPLSFPP